jgi:CBS domain-containing protein
MGMQYLGFFDMLSAVFVAMKAASPDKPLHMHFSQLTLAEVVTGPRFGPFIPLSTTHTLLDAMLLLGKYGLRRLPIVEAGGDLVNIVTQSQLLQLMVDNAAVLASVETKTLTELGLGDAHPVFSVSIDATTQAAFNTMQQHDVSALAIVGHTNELIGAISSRDARLLVGPGAGPLQATLHYPLRVFLEALNKVVLLDGLRKAPQSVFSFL